MVEHLLAGADVVMTTAALAAVGPTTPACWWTACSPGSPVDSWISAGVRLFAVPSNGCHPVRPLSATSRWSALQDLRPVARSAARDFLLYPLLGEAAQSQAAGITKTELNAMAAPANIGFR